MDFLSRRFISINSVISILFALALISPSQATTTYTVTYNANENQHQTGATTGSVPTTTTENSGALVTVASNSGNLARQGFTFAGWNTQSNGSGTTYAAGTGTFNISQNMTLYAKWEIPESARLISSGGGEVVTISGHASVTNGTKCNGGFRGITTDGTYIYFRTNTDSSYLCKATLNGVLVSATSVTGLSAISIDARDLTYSANCVYVRTTGTSSDTLKCIDLGDNTLNTIAQPSGKELLAGTVWLVGNLIDFPDGRIGAVSGNNQVLPTGTGSGQCPSGLYCKILRLYSVSGSGKSSTLTFSEDIILADTESNWPDDDHGIATDGTYLYQSRYNSGYKVWALASGSPSYLVFNGSGSGTCQASSGVSGTLCLINQPVSTGTTSLTNATFFGRSHATQQYLMGDYSNNKFFKSNGVAPPAGPGSASAPSAPTINSISAGDQQLSITFTAGSDGGSAITNYKYSTDGTNYLSLSPPDTTSPLVITKLSSDGTTTITNGTAYSITIKASNSAGDSVASNTVSATPSSVPNAPTLNSATGGAGTLSLTFTAGSDGGSSITNYQYSFDSGVTWTSVNPSSTSSPLSITGLTAGTYSVIIRALNAIGNGSDSNVLTATVTAVASSGGGSSSSSSITPTPTPTPSSSIRPTPRPTNLINNPLIFPTPSPSPTQSIIVPGTQNRPEPLTRRLLEEVINSLKPKIIDLFSSPSPNSNNATSNSSQNSNPSQNFDNQRALELTQTSTDKKVVSLPSLVLVDNVPQPSKIVIVDNTTAQIVTPSGGLMNVAAKDGENKIPVDTRGRVQMVRDNNVETQGQGLAPNTEFAVYLFSEPKLLGVGLTDSSGKFYASFPVEADLPIGDHTLQVNGQLPDGKTASVSLPIVLVDSINTAKNQAMPKTILVDDNPVDLALNTLYFIIALFVALIVFMLFGGSKLLIAAFKKIDK